MLIRKSTLETFHLPQIIESVKAKTYYLRSLELKREKTLRILNIGDSMDGPDKFFFFFF